MYVYQTKRIRYMHNYSSTSFPTARMHVWYISCPSCNWVYTVTCDISTLSCSTSCGTSACCHLCCPFQGWGCGMQLRWELCGSLVRYEFMAHETFIFFVASVTVQPVSFPGLLRFLFVHTIIQQKWEGLWSMNVRWTGGVHIWFSRSWISWLWLSASPLVRTLDNLAWPVLIAVGLTSLCVMNAHRPFATLPLPCITVNAKWRTNNGVGLGIITRLPLC